MEKRETITMISHRNLSEGGFKSARFRAFRAIRANQCYVPTNERHKKNIYTPPCQLILRANLQKESTYYVAKRSVDEMAQKTGLYCGV